MGYDELKTNKELSERQQLVVSEVKKVVEQNMSLKSQIGVLDSFIDKYGTLTCVFCGGLNGPGKWDDYFLNLGIIVKDLEKYGIYAWFISGFNDCLDDVFYFNFGIREEKE